MRTEKLKKAALRRKHHVRNKVVGTAERPRLSVFRSHRQIYAQLIDDGAGVTLVAASSLAKVLQEQLPRAGNKKAAEVVGEALAKQALDMGIKCVCFDRGSYKYHGRVKSLADAARKAGLVF
ncbi:MAG: 50S ribosomal protein L18 [Planctomycetes bacterium]|jgi:large subunit ribosomal protein L18|nr:50S ribosomal protein L18 [Planctomycetota bacterium]